jgi:hypothetical protein
LKNVGLLIDPAVNYQHISFVHLSVHPPPHLATRLFHQSFQNPSLAIPKEQIVGVVGRQ